MPDPARITLSDSQRDQLRQFRSDHEHTGHVELRPVETLPEGYVEAVILDADGEDTAAKRVLFP